jgi:murein DD-endopeptidase MepM/ murein hydrolase activator NlpD
LRKKADEMQYIASRSRARHSAGLCVAVAAFVALGGCSGGTSRFDYPSFGVANRQADPMATASVTPVPSQPVYGGSNYGGGQGGAAVASRALPPIGSQPEPYPYAQAEASPVPRVQQAAYPGPAAAPRQAYAAAEMQANRGGAFSGRHRVGGGETLFGIARKHRVSHTELASHNDISPTASLKIGQVLKVPGGASAPARAPLGRAVAKKQGGAPQVRVVKTVDIAAPEPQPAKPIRVAAVGPAPIPPENPERERRSDVVLAKADPSEQATPREERPVQRNAALPEPEPMTGNSFRWPVKGKIISEFGTKPNGSHNDGINVAVPQGTSVKAAENGVVAYAGSELKGYGNLILIRHANNWVSAYAHNDAILVKRGDKVRRGQIISKAGKTGSVSQPQVHFELRKGSRPVDPTKYMKEG